MKTPHCVQGYPYLLALVVVLSPASADAQVVRGTVVSEGAGVPLRGAVVTLFDATGNTVNRRVLTDSDGGFAMRAPSAGSWLLEARAIGYAPRRTAARTVTAGETVVEWIVLRQVATRLATLRVEAKSACRRANELDAVTSEVWDDVWAALAAAQLAREQRLVRAEVFVYTREMDVSTGLVMREERGVASVLDESPFRTAPAAELTRLGFWRTSPLGEVEFHGLDAATIISTDFLAGHCFNLVRRDSAGTPLVGLAFRPVSDRARADVQGYLWLDAESRELRTIEFTYTGLKLRGPAAGGRLGFTRLPNGVLIDDRWLIQHPFEQGRAVGAQRTGIAAAPDPALPAGTTLRIGGGFVLADSARLRQFATVAGLVRRDSSPADAAAVELLGSGQRFVTDSTGVFLIQDVLPGTYEVRVMRPGPADRGGFVQHGQLALAPGDVARVMLDIPESDSIASELCPGKSEGMAPLFVVLREEHSGKPAANYRVEARWTPPTDSSGAPLGRPGGVRALTDWRGEFVACDVPAGASVSFRTTTGEAQWSMPIRVGGKLNILEIAADTSGTGRR
ncbi:MAG TPA: carboxypeptidase-like regulatory domain-containing protein [Gemmatimonadaceae bacterium]